MIYIMQPKIKNKLCDDCGGGNNVKTIVIRYLGTNSGTQFTLCKECREVLLEELKNSDLR